MTALFDYDVLATHLSLELEPDGYGGYVASYESMEKVWCKIEINCSLPANNLKCRKIEGVYYNIEMLPLKSISAGSLLDTDDCTYEVIKILKRTKLIQEVLARCILKY